ncbi:MAG: SPOR domain-containing protein [Arcobacteraceae bacterium]|nr:SPOR domain-containing protein [Arcobacteraceae bacterium]
MEFKSEEFLRKVEKASQNRDNNNGFEQDEIYAEEQSGYNLKDSRQYSNEPNSELEDILLSANSSSTDKKKYIILAASLIVLFLLTLILVKVFSGSSEETLTKETTEQISQDKALEGQSIEQEYQRIINERLKKLQEQKESENQPTQNTETTPPQEQQIVAEEEITPVETPAPIVQKQEVVTPPKAQTQKVVVPKVETPKQATVTPTQPKQTANNKTATLKGYFIQVGAFSKDPNQEFLTKIKTSGYQYKIYQDLVNGIMYNKVLVGPYNSNIEARSQIENIKRDLGLNSAFVLGF